MTTKVVFADTFYWVALTNPADSRYQEANAFDKSLAGTRIVATDEVLAEFLTFFASDAWFASQGGVDCPEAFAQA